MKPQIRSDRLVKQSNGPGGKLIDQMELTMLIWCWRKLFKIPQEELDYSVSSSVLCAVQSDSNRADL